MTTATRVAIIHPWLPAYRAPFFENLLHAAQAQSVDLHIYYGPPPPEWKARGDAASIKGARELKARTFPLQKRHLIKKDLSPLRSRAPYDLMICEHAVRNLETYQILANRGPWTKRFAWWGHGRTYTAPSSHLEGRFKDWLIRRADWFFSYTPGGASYVSAQGFPPDRVTVVNNSIDTTSLRRQLDRLQLASLQVLRLRFDLRNKTALFIGGLDDSKRLPFLFRAAQLVHERDPDFRLIVAGDGTQRALVERFTDARSWCHYVGRVDGPEKAALMAVSDVLAMPGRVGLVAVDSFAARVPIVTTSWPYHAPEFEYLEHAKAAVVTDDHIDAYAKDLTLLLEDRGQLRTLSDHCATASSYYSLENMTGNFMRGILDCLSTPRG